MSHGVSSLEELPEEIMMPRLDEECEIKLVLSYNGSPAQCAYIVEQRTIKSVAAPYPNKDRSILHLNWRGAHRGTRDGSLNGHEDIVGYIK